MTNCNGAVGNIDLRKSSVVNELEAPSGKARGGNLKKVAFFAAKLLVTGACFWYASRQIDLSQIGSAIPRLDFRWAAFAALVVMLQIPLLGARWCNVVDALIARNAQMNSVTMIVLTAIGVFLAQVLPSLAGEGVRAWLLVRLGCDWRNALTSVLIDRGIGLGVLVAMGFFILLLPSSLTALGGYRDLVVVVYGALILAGGLGLLFVPTISLPLARWRYSRWFATLATDVHRVLLGPRGLTIVVIGSLVYMLTIVVVWSLGRAQGLSLPLSDAAVLLIVMVGVTLVPISIGGWGLRELAVVSLLGNHGVPPEKALLFSVCFGLTLAIGSLPGAVVWLLYSLAPARHSAEGGE
jgi:glycosyltransferase 2 family protein